MERKPEIPVMPSSTALPRCLAEVLSQLIRARPEPAQTVLWQGLLAARTSRGLLPQPPYAPEEADTIVTTLLERMDAATTTWEPLAWAVYAFGCGRDKDVARVLIDGQDPDVTQPVRRALANRANRL